MAAAVLLLAACSGGSTSEGPAPADRTFEAEEFDGVDRAAFYELPDPLPDAEHGTLLRYERIDAPVDGAAFWKVMYLSESLPGDPVAVTGVVAVPEGEPPAGGWKLLSVAHGTTGSGDECALSSVDLPDAPATTDPGHPTAVVADDLYVGLPAAGYLADGYAIAVTDYEGLGTPGVHPYLVGESEGRSVIDVARAARQLPGAEVGTRYAVWGYSQGGHGAAWANEVAAEWAPELELVGTVAGAPPSETTIVARALATSSPPADLFFMMVAGYAAAYPELDPADILTPAGLDALDHVEDGCMDLGDALGGRSMAELVRPGFAEAEDWQARLAENEPGRRRADAPLLIVHSSADTGVPAELSAIMFRRMCDLDQVVERRVYERGQDHDAAVGDAITDGLRWVEGLMSGERPISSCP